MFGVCVADNCLACTPLPSSRVQSLLSRFNNENRSLDSCNFPTIHPYRILGVLARQADRSSVFAATMNDPGVDEPIHEVANDLEDNPYEKQEKLEKEEEEDFLDPR